MTQQTNKNQTNSQEPLVYSAYPTHSAPSMPGAAPVSPPEYAEVSAATKEPFSPKKKSKLPIILVFILVLLLAGGCFAYFQFFKHTPVGETAEPVPEPSMTTVELYPDREVTKEQLASFAAVVEERVKVLGDAYEISVDEEKITLCMDKSLLGTTTAERKSTIELLTGRGSVNLSTSGYVSLHSPSRTAFSTMTVEALNKNEILSTYGTCISAAHTAQLQGLTTETVYGLAVDLTEEDYNKVEKMTRYTHGASKLVAIHDYDKESYQNSKLMGSVLTGNKDKKTTIYLLSSGAAYQKNCELMKMVLTQAEMDFGVVMRIVDEPVWQREESDFGACQVASLSEEGVVLECTPDDATRTYGTEANFDKYVASVKNRLDILGIEYMFGTSGFDNKTYCVKLAPNRLAPDFVRLIFGEAEFATRSNFDTMDFFLDPEVVEENGTYVIRGRCVKSYEQLHDTYNITNDTVYLVVNDVTVAKANLSDMVPMEGLGEYRLAFQEFLCFGDKQVGQDEKSVLDLLCAIYDEDNVPFQGEYRFCSYNEGKAEEQNVGDISWKYDSATEEDAFVFSQLQGKCHDVEKIVSARNALTITLDIPINGNLPINFINRTKELYQLCRFDDGAYNKIVFVIKDETAKSPANRCRIEVNKDTNTGKMEVTSSVSGPKFMQFWKTFYEMTKEDSFFTERQW